MAKHEDDKAPVKFYIAAALGAGDDGLPTIVALTPAMDDQTQAEKTARLYAEEHPGTWTTVLAPAETNRGYAVCFRGAVRVDHEGFNYPNRARAAGDPEPPPPEPLGLDAWRNPAPEPTLPLRGSTRAEAEARAIPGLKEPLAETPGVTKGLSIGDPVVCRYGEAWADGAIVAITPDNYFHVLIRGTTPPERIAFNPAYVFKRRSQRSLEVGDRVAAPGKIPATVTEIVGKPADTWRIASVQDNVGATREVAECLLDLMA
jgi:hypothetical protein